MSRENAMKTLGMPGAAALVLAGNAAFAAGPGAVAPQSEVVPDEAACTVPGEGVVAQKPCEEACEEEDVEAACIAVGSVGAAAPFLGGSLGGAGAASAVVLGAGALAAAGLGDDDSSSGSTTTTPTNE
ncbi:hypothetical protein C2I36_01915 [Rhodobacteraceae bacterium WD3A24]|nr:hypothetical protein C2I36_01915 [Rhodobacteraceae bacterium WD3A24]